MLIAVIIAFLAGLACGVFGHKWIAAEAAKAPTYIADEFKKL